MAQWHSATSKRSLAYPALMSLLDRVLPSLSTRTPPKAESLMKNGISAGLARFYAALLTTPFSQIVGIAAGVVALILLVGLMLMLKYKGKWPF
ncbi:hypothetical protein BC832DRAFT_549377 [Gaertneriomyces semiglobifer]|nr:hypothetical protein BC832DRAFT_549377 [Gaertneriomyces semiglobifer]